MIIVQNTIRFIYDPSKYYHAKSATGKNIFLKIKSSPNDLSLRGEYKNGLIVNTLESPNFLKTYDLQNLPSEFFPRANLNTDEVETLITEYDPSPTFVDYSRQMKIPMPEVVDIFRSVSLILIHAYFKIGFIHGDLRPGNIIVNNEKRKIRIYDFGKSFFVSHSSDPVIEVQNRKQLLKDLEGFANIIINRKNNRELINEFIRFFKNEFVYSNNNFQQFENIFLSFRPIMKF